MATICLLSVKTIKSAYPHPERLHILRKWQKNWETERERETVTRMNIFILFRFKRYWDAVIVCRISETISTYTNPLPLRRILLETQLSLPLRRSHLRGPISAIRIICVVGFSSHSDRNPINVCLCWEWCCWWSSQLLYLPNMPNPSHREGCDLECFAV